MGSNYSMRDTSTGDGSGMGAPAAHIDTSDDLRRDFERRVGISVPRAAQVLCNGVADLAGEADHGLLVCRGYLVFAEMRTFCEHWWCRVKGRRVVFDPLFDLCFAGAEVERLEVGAAPSHEYDAVGTFDCLAMKGPCTRIKQGKPPCEWCVARSLIEGRSPAMQPRELTLLGGFRYL